MKKTISLLLALVLCLSLCACGSGKASADTFTTETPTTEALSVAEYALGEVFGTDNVECIVTEIKWVTPEEFDAIAKYSHSNINGEHFYHINTELLYPECVNVFGYLGGIKSKISDKYFLLVTFSLQNCGKEVVTYTEEPSGTGGYFVLPYGTFEVIYDDGYVFDCGTENGFTTKLDVLGDAIKTLGGCMVPSQVYKNTDKPLKIKVMLPNSNGETEEFFVSVR